MHELRKKAYCVWRHMKSRCYCKTDHDYHNYGGRGIEVCDCWKKSFNDFYDYVSKLENFEKKGFSFNRIDNNKSYEPGNVEWADVVSQNNNKRDNKLIEYQGKTQTLGQWAKELGFDYKIVWHRLYRLNWKPADAFTNKKYPKYHKKGDS